VFGEQNDQLKVGIKFNNGSLHHVTPNTSLASTNNQKGGGE
jgi:hypothetical protein